MFALLFYVGLAVWTGWLLRKYKLTGEKKRLQSAGSLVMAAFFFLALQTAYYSVLYPGREWVPFLVLLLGAAVGGMTFAAGYQGGGKLSALGQIALYIAFADFIVNSVPYFSRPLKVAHTFSECAKVVPGAGGAPRRRPFRRPRSRQGRAGSRPPVGAGAGSLGGNFTALSFWGGGRL
ncbi:MAG: hypothetical protein RQ748_08370 [Elusimicrobiales bacterium]|nr:hypothetical protein [Elusimicrobiales bacterium]